MADFNEKAYARQKFRSSRGRGGRRGAGGHRGGGRASGGPARPAPSDGLDSNAFRYDDESAAPEDGTVAPRSQGADLEELLAEAEAADGGALSSAAFFRFRAALQDIGDEAPPLGATQAPDQLLAIDLHQLGECLSALPLHQLLGLEPHFLAGCEPAAAPAPAPAASGAAATSAKSTPIVVATHVTSSATAARPNVVAPAPVPVVPVMVTPVTSTPVHSAPPAAPAAAAASSAAADEDEDDDAELAALLTGRPVAPATAKPVAAGPASGAVGLRPQVAAAALPSASLQPRPGLPAASAMPATVATVVGPAVARPGAGNAAVGMPAVPKIVAGLPVRVAGGAAAATSVAAVSAPGPPAAGAGSMQAAGSGMDDEMRLLLGLPPIGAGAAAATAAAAPPRVGLPQSTVQARPVAKLGATTAPPAAAAGVAASAGTKAAAQSLDDWLNSM